MSKAGAVSGEDNTDFDRVVRWLSERVPETDTVALCHGDYRTVNAMSHRTEPRVNKRPVPFDQEAER
jgi:aminoglycoside phosphotransferase (APT) family kinase protein